MLKLCRVTEVEMVLIATYLNFQPPFWRRVYYTQSSLGLQRHFGSWFVWCPSHTRDRIKFTCQHYRIGLKNLAKRRLGNAAFTRPGIKQNVKKAVAARGFQEFVKRGEGFDLIVILMND